MNHYETVFILTPVLSAEQIKEAVEKFKKVLTDNGGEIVNRESWGLRRLAYPIENKNTGYYNLIEFDGEPTIVDKLEVAFRRDERILRFLTTRLDKFAYEYAAKRRTLRREKIEERIAQEEAAKAEAEALQETIAATQEETAAVVEEAAEVVKEAAQAVETAADQVVEEAGAAEKETKE